MAAGQFNSAAANSWEQLTGTGLWQSVNLWS